MKTIDYLILGAGITGLSLAYHLKEKNYAVYERDSRVGGMCKTVSKNGFYFDYGEHFIRADDNYVCNLISGILADNLQSQALNAAIYLDGKMVDYPFQTNLYGLSADTVKSCLLGYIIAWCKHQNNQEETTENNFEKWIYSTFGDGIANYFMIPYNEKIWTIPPSEMTIDWFFNESVVPKGNLDLVVEGALHKQEVKKSMRWYPIRGGIISLAEGFLRYLKNVHLNKGAVEIDSIKKCVTFQDGEVIQYKNLINTIPLPELVSIIRNVPPKIKKAANNLVFNSVFCVNLGIAREDISKQHWIYFPEKKFVFARAYFMSNFSKFMVPKGCSSVSAMITYSKFKSIDKKNIVERVIADLKAAGILKESDEIITQSTLDVPYGFNLFTHNRTANIELIKNYLKERNINTIGRYGNWEYSGIEHAILNSRNLSNQLVQTNTME
jgi:UDP-galactopyranose mutase